MPGFVTGDRDVLTVKHPTLGARQLPLKSGSDFTYEVGGRFTSDDDGNITSDGRYIKNINQKPWMFTCTVVDDDRTANLDFLQNIAGDPEDAVFTSPSYNGSIRSGEGTPVGSIELNSQSGEIALTCMGGGFFELISI